MIMFKGIEEKYKDYDLKVLGYKEIKIESLLYNEIEFSYNVCNQEYKDKVIVRIDENIAKKIINKIQFKF